MPRLVQEQHRHGVGYGVQLVSRGVPPLLQLGIVIAEADDQAGVAHQRLVPVHPVARDPLQGGDVIPFAVRRRQEVGVARLQPDHGDVPVRIEEARQQGPPVKIHQARASPRRRAHRVQGADRQDGLPAHRHGLGRRLRIVHGEDRTAVEDRRRRRAGLDGARRHQTAGGGAGHKQPPVQIAPGPLRHNRFSLFERQSQNPPSRQTVPPLEIRRSVKRPEARNQCLARTFITVSS